MRLSNAFPNVLTWRNSSSLPLPSLTVTMLLASGCCEEAHHVPASEGKSPSASTREVFAANVERQDLEESFSGQGLGRCISLRSESLAGWTPTGRR